MTGDCLRVESDKELLLSCLWLRSSVVLGPYKLNQSKSNRTHTPVNSYGNPYSFKTARRRLERCCCCFLLTPTNYVRLVDNSVRLTVRMTDIFQSLCDSLQPALFPSMNSFSFAQSTETQTYTEKLCPLIMILRFTVDLGS